MTIDFRESFIGFPSRSGERRRSSNEGLTQRINFGGKEVLNASVLLKGYKARFDNDEHPLLELEIDLDHQIVDSNGDGVRDSVVVDADFVLRDQSGNFDDP